MLFYILNWLVYGGGVFVGWVNLVFSLFISSLQYNMMSFVHVIIAVCCIWKQKLKLYCTTFPGYLCRDLNMDLCIHPYHVFLTSFVFLNVLNYLIEFFEQYFLKEISLIMMTLYILMCGINFVHSCNQYWHIMYFANYLLKFAVPPFNMIVCSFWVTFVDIP